MAYGFVAYIDESGDDGLRCVRPKYPDGSSEWFVLSAVVVRASNENAVGRWHRGILEKFEQPQRRDIHYRRLADAKKTIACHEIACAALRCFVVMSNKKNIEGYRNDRCYPEKNYLYWWMTRLLLERVTKFCAKWSQRLYQQPRPIKMIFSERGGMSYDRLISYLNLIRFQTEAGNLYLKTGKLDWSVVDLRSIYVMAHANEAGLQFADVVAGAFYQSVTLDGKRPCRAEYAKILVPRLYRGPRAAIINFGLKPMPKLQHMKLEPRQREIFDHVGFPQGGWR
jgi:Protein of unknown function (DUF3800)